LLGDQARRFNHGNAHLKCEDWVNEGNVCKAHLARHDHVRQMNRGNRHVVNQVNPEKAHLKLSDELKRFNR
jgi:hypothetical protein